MGHKPQRKVYRLNFSDTDEAGLEVTIRPPNIAGLLELQAVADLGDKATAADVEKMFRRFAGMLVSWNVEDDDDQPVPATYDGVTTQDPAFIHMIMAAYQQNVAGVPGPLPNASSNGGPALEASLPMDLSSPSPQS